MSGLVKTAVKMLFPDHTARGRSVRMITARLGLSQPGGPQGYEAFTRLVEPMSFFPPLRDSSAGDCPLFSVVVPFYNTPDKYLIPLLDSLASQSFSDWELLMGDASTDPTVSRRIRQLAASDPRFHYLKLSTNGGISRNTNAILTRVSGQFVVFADHDDTLNRHALNEMAVAIADHPGVGILYSDEDVLSDDGLVRKGPFFKPDWSPHMFLEMNYTNHLSVIRRDLIESVGGLQARRDGAQDYDLLLRIHARHHEVGVVHVPKMLYHWREAEHSTARTISTKSYAIDAGRHALDDYLTSIAVGHEDADNVPDRPGWYRVRPRRHASVEVIVKVTDDSRLNRQIAQMVRARTHSDWCSVTYTALAGDEHLLDRVRRSGSDVIVVIRQMALPLTRDWLDDLVGVTALPHTAAVSPLLLDSSQRWVLNSGWVSDGDGLSALYQGCAVNSGGLAGPVDLVRDVDGLSNDVLVFAREHAPAVAQESPVLDARDWAEHALLWGHVRFQVCPVPSAGGLLNANLRPSGSGVRLQSEIEAK
ncbi:MAG: glycosyltransferase [Propionibacteriaceae bacterium]|jgi:glycosyltransferase involved in cell wall biosynthesis|nr:glycosyltransferase [Propionibacteriaceae bacterium]